MKKNNEELNKSKKNIEKNENKIGKFENENKSFIKQILFFI